MIKQPSSQRHYHIIQVFFFLLCVIVLITAAHTILVSANGQPDQDQRRESNRQFWEERHEVEEDDDDNDKNKRPDPRVEIELRVAQDTDNNNQKLWKNFDNGLEDEPSDFGAFNDDEGDVDESDGGRRSHRAMAMQNAQDATADDDIPKDVKEKNYKRYKLSSKKGKSKQEKFPEEPDLSRVNFHGQREGTQGTDPNLIAPFQRPTQLVSDDYTFYTPIEVSIYKTRLQCDTCRSIFAILDERIKHNSKRDGDIAHSFDDNFFGSITDLLEKIVDAPGTIDADDEDLSRICKDSANTYDGLCMRDILGNLEIIQKKLKEDTELPANQNHLRTSSFAMCSAIGMCKKRF